MISVTLLGKDNNNSFNIHLADNNLIHNNQFKEDLKILTNQSIYHLDPSNNSNRLIKENK